MIVLVLGGTRSGKSGVAERRATALAAADPTRPAVTYLATAPIDAADADHQARVALHRARRPPSWATVECGHDLAAALGARPDGTVVVDSLGSWVAAHPDLDADVDLLVRALQARRGNTVLVAEEVGSSVHPSSPLARRFVDRLGEVNQAIAAVADEVLLVVAGRPLPLPVP